jgi:[ribosomal protein S5]-alanine N-acetyltransferase
MNIDLETPRLILRDFTERDASGLLDYLSQPQPSCFASDQIHTLEEALAKIHQRQQSQDYVAVCLRDTDQLIGEIFFMREEPDTYSVGWNFNPRFQGKGYAKESTEAWINFLFEQCDARRIYAYVEDDNLASQKLCERLGFRKEGLFLEFISFVNHADGTPKYENTLQYAVLKKEWKLKQV